jgi:hypothetical protein
VTRPIDSKQSKLPLHNFSRTSTLPQQPSHAGKSLEFIMLTSLLTYTPKADNTHRLPHLRENLSGQPTPTLPGHASLLPPHDPSLLLLPRTPNIRPHALYPAHCLQPRNQRRPRTFQQRFRERHSSYHLRCGKTLALQQRCSDSRWSELYQGLEIPIILRSQSSADAALCCAYWDASQSG